MSEIGFKKMNWMPRASAWEEHQVRLEKRRAAMEAFAQQQATLVNAFASAFSFQLTSSVDNVAKTASDRIIAEGRKQVEDQQAALTAGVNKVA
ncbi:hypothetical protein [Pelagibacterium montanilacus]|uniref:hypothetical protein n=1 Tax=Pelagibacterium montanilacus TaxID=2185280 RepID=UPI000F8C7339|nr:hypothetical protein [Pelagibacterium montanilacus]